MYDAGKLDIAIENTLLDMALFEKELTAAYEEMDAIRIGTRFIDRDLKTVTEQRDEWKAKFIQQNKDLGCEMMDPNGTIWDYAKKLQTELPAAREEIVKLTKGWADCVLERSKAEEQRDKYRDIASELIAMIRINVMRDTFKIATIEQVDEHLKPWIERIAAVKGGADES